MTNGPCDIRRARKLLFVCMGNICRSPLAEAVFAGLADERGVRGQFTLDSCGTGGWHVGESADPRTVVVAGKYGMTLDHCARQIDPRRDFDAFDLLLPMDQLNYRHVVDIADPDRHGRIRMMRSFDRTALGDKAGVSAEGPDVPDPYYGGPDGFDRMYWILRESCEGLLDFLLGPGGGGAPGGG